MRAHVLTASLFGALMVCASAGGAGAETWCRNGTMCVFGSYQQCLSSIRVMGGACTRESAARHAPRSSSRHARYSSSPLPVNLNPSRFDCAN